MALVDSPEIVGLAAQRSVGVEEIGGRIDFDLAFVFAANGIAAK